MKRKTLTSASLAVLFASAAAAQDAPPYDPTCANGPANAVVIFDALYDSRGKVAPNNATKLGYVEEILTHQGVDVGAYTTAEKACMFNDVVWQDLLARYRAARRAARQAESQTTIDTAVSGDVTGFEGADQ